MKASLNCALLILTTFTGSHFIHENSAFGEKIEIPKNLNAGPSKPTQPPKLAANVKEITPLGCLRKFTHQNKTGALDSYHCQDAEKIRPVLQEVPEALLELNAYQSGKESAKIVAYTGSIGLLMLLTGLIAGSQLEGTPRELVRTVGVFGGAGILAGSTIYGVIAIQANENHLDRAIERYNHVRPEGKIELKVGASVF